MKVMTSDDSPIRIAELPTPVGGLLGMTICPGKHAPTSVSGHGWARDLATDVAAIRTWGASSVVTLMESWELDRYAVSSIAQVVQAEGMAWFHLPIVDGRAPDSEWLREWSEHNCRKLFQRLAQGDRVLVHCLGGRGRTGTVAAMLMMEAGVSAKDAIDRVRAIREGAVETEEQEKFLFAYQAGHSSPRDTIS